MQALEGNLFFPSFKVVFSLLSRSFDRDTGFHLSMGA